VSPRPAVVTTSERQEVSRSQAQSPLAASRLPESQPEAPLEDAVAQSPRAPLAARESSGTRAQQESHQKLSEQDTHQTGHPETKQKPKSEPQSEPARPETQQQTRSHISQPHKKSQPQISQQPQGAQMIRRQAVNVTQQGMTASVAGYTAGPLSETDSSGQKQTELSPACIFDIILGGTSFHDLEDASTVHPSGGHPRDGGAARVRVSTDVLFSSFFD